ncbi:PAS domain-containing protein [Shewanella sp. Isolate11]|uniref:PAS domain-containing protein n=1 Tax=Shewanella sp. Isolate11 TaxID=2908530 RepID=UPI001EFCE56C|nr:PAS domain-containing protein [Shewanella sp. Isolate11]MCG9695733.1 PAS domain-containing protein [Shewanella sp. Isolate11]
MLKQKTQLLLAGQGLHWSTQRIVSVATQITILLISMVLLTKVIITIGERRLQEDWAAQRYSELQTVGTLLADRVSFQQFRTQMFASSELLKRYLTIPSEERQKKLQQNWTGMTGNTPELLDIALFDAQGEFKFSTTNLFSRQPLPASLLGGARNMGGSEIYTSPLEFIPINGKLEPYMYQLAWLENPDQTIRGYLVTYQSMSRMLKSIKPGYSALEAPLLMLDTQGLIYAGVDKKLNVNRIPDIMGGSLRQSYPALWRKMANTNFGQFHGDDATFVYLKIELTTQYETRREYYLASYVRNSEIAENFSDWSNVLIVGAIVMTLLGILLIFLSHAYRIGQRSREFSIELANRLFSSDIGCIIVNENNRVVTANEKAAKLLSMPLDELSDRNLQRILQLENDQYGEIIEQLQKNNKWHSVIDFEEQYGCSLSVTVSQSKRRNKKGSYLVVTFEDISQLKQVQQQAHLSQLLNDNAVASALLQANGDLLLSNDEFLQLFAIHDVSDKKLTQLLNNDIETQWSRIVQQLQLQGTWKGQVLCNPDSKENNSLQATLKGHLDQAGEVEYIVCTLESCSQNYLDQHRGEFMPHRSTILINHKDLEDYFSGLDKASREDSSLLLLDITAESMLSHMSDIGQLESRQREVEIHILKSLPSGYQMSHWQLGKLIVIMPNTHSDEAHHFALSTLDSLNEIGLGAGICMGIASYQPEQTLEQYINNAEVALKRAKQIGEKNICQAFTRQS